VHEVPNLHFCCYYADAAVESVGKGAGEKPCGGALAARPILAATSVVRGRNKAFLGNSVIISPTIRGCM